MRTIGSDRIKHLLDTIASLVLIAAAGLVIYQTIKRDGSRQPGTPPIPTAPIPLDEAITKGNPHAPAVLIMYSDFECPFCRRFSQGVLPRIQEGFVADGKLMLAFRHLPLPSHEHAEAAAVAAQCAHAQGKFWQMHDRIFADNLTSESTREHARSLGLNEEAFERCLDGPDASGFVRRSFSEAVSLGVRSTPTLLLGYRVDNNRVQVRHVIRGASSDEELGRLINGLSASKGWFSWLTHALYE